MDIGIIGFGAIGRTLFRLLAEHDPTVRVTMVIEQASLHDQVRTQVPESTQVVEHAGPQVKDLDLVIECAGHAALRATGPQVLMAGVDLLVASVGAFADRSLETALRRAAADSGAKIRIPSGALGGLDVLGAARLAGLDSVTYASSKAPRAWRGTPAESMIDLDGLTDAAVFYSGTARDAATQFPQNANVAAAVALAGLGFDETRVQLSADPRAEGNRHRIHALGRFGEIDVSILGKTLPENPKTSMLAPFSLLRSVMNLTRTLVIG